MKSFKAFRKTLKENKNSSLKDMIKDARERLKQRDALSDKLAKTGKAVRFSHSEKGKKALAGPDVSKPGKFRITYFDDKGPVGHTEHKTLKDAIKDGLSQKYIPDKEK